MERQIVESKNIRSVGYDADQFTLEVEFHDGGIYQYYNVPRYIFTEMTDGRSVGSYFALYVKGKFDYKKVG